MSTSSLYPDGRRLLVIANETVEEEALWRAIHSRAADGPVAVLVVAPALNSRLRHWLSDEDAAREAAEQRVANCLERLAAAGIEANGQVGDADPIQAIADALRSFLADELIISTHPEERSNWLARNVVERARLRFGCPILHILAGHEQAERHAVVLDARRAA